jgi:hypothetical protein
MQSFALICEGLILAFHKAERVLVFRPYIYHLLTCDNQKSDCANPSRYFVETWRWFKIPFDQEAA